MNTSSLVLCHANQQIPAPVSQNCQDYWSCAGRHDSTELRLVFEWLNNIDAPYYNDPFAVPDN